MLAELAQEAPVPPQPPPPAPGPTAPPPQAIETEPVARNDDRAPTLQELADAADNPSGAGIQCPKCRSRLSSVYYVRNRDDSRERSRVCLHCAHRFQTREERIG